MDKYLDKIPTKEIYEDIFRPGLKKAGEALGTVIDGANLILLPLKLLNSKSRIYFKKNIELYEKKLEKSKNLKMIQVPQYVGLPIVDKLTYLNQEELAEIFINLLTKASFDETLNMVHPAYLSVLNNLSTDEAKILFHYNSHIRIPFVDIFIHRYQEKIPRPEYMDDRGTKKTKEQLKRMIEYSIQNKEDAHLKIAWNLSGMEKTIDLSFPRNIDIYLENLERNGLISFERNKHSPEDTPTYETLIDEIYKDQIEEIEDYIRQEKESNVEHQFEINIKKGFIVFTEFGKGFLKACIKEIEGNEA